MIRDKTSAGVAALASAAALGVAIGSERFGGLVPCALCLVERWPYRFVLALGLVALMLPSNWRFLRKGLLWSAVLCMAGSAVASVVHIGVEQGQWQSPLPECMAPTLWAGSIAERLAHMPLQASKQCDEPTYLVPGLPVSMAVMNLVLSLSLGGFLGFSLSRRDAALRPRGRHAPSQAHG